MAATAPDPDMEAVRLAPTVGIVACLAVLAGLAAPYLLVSDPGAVGTYYGIGPFNPLFAGLFALVGLVVFAAGRQDRTDPALAAGAALVLGLFGAAMTVAWAASVPGALVFQLGENTLVEYHRAVLVVVTLAVPAAAGWYARALGVV